MPNPFGDEPDTQGANPFGDHPDGPAGANPFGDHPDSTGYAAQSAKFQQNAGVQAAADQHVKDKWAEYGRIAGQSQGAAIREHAAQVYGLKPDPSPIPALDYRPEHDPIMQASYVRSQLANQPDGIGRVQQLEDRWRQEYLHTALFNADQTQKNAGSHPVAPDVGVIHGAVDSVLRNAAHAVTDDVQGGTELYYSLGNYDANEGLRGASAKPGRDQIARDASMAAIEKWQQNIDEAYPQSTNAANGGWAKHLETVLGAATQIGLAGGGLKAGGIRKGLALGQMGGQIFGNSYAEQYKAGLAQGLTDTDASRNALMGGLADAAANTYLMKFGVVGELGNPAVVTKVRQAVAMAVKDAIAQGLVGGSQQAMSDITKFVATGEGGDAKNILDAAYNNALLGGVFGAGKGAMEYAAGRGKPNPFGDKPNPGQTKPAESSVPGRSGADVVVPAPDAETLKNALISPEAPNGPNPDSPVNSGGGGGVDPGRVGGDGQVAQPAGPPAEPLATPLLDKAPANHRVNLPDGTSKAVPVDFADKNDKALYAATSPRQGKVSAEARTHLTAQGYDEARIADEGAKLRDHVKGLYDADPDAKRLGVAKPEDRANVQPAESGVRGTNPDEPAPVPATPDGGRREGRSEELPAEVQPQPEAVRPGEDGAAEAPRVDPVGGERRASGESEVSQSPASDGYRTEMDRMRKEADTERAASVERLKAKNAGIVEKMDEPKRIPTPDAPATNKETAEAFKAIKRIYSGVVAYKPANRLQAGMADLIQRTTGRRVVYVGGKDIPFKGVVHNDHPSTVFVHTDTPAALLRKVAWHELFHTFQQQHPELAGRIADLFPKATRDQVLGDYVKRAERNNADGYADRLKANPQHMDNELGASLFEGLANNPRIMESLSGEHKTVLAKIVDWFRNLFGKGDKPLSPFERTMKGYVDQVAEALRTGDRGEPEQAEPMKLAASQVSQAPLGAEKFVKDDVVDRAKDAWDAVGKAWDGVKRLVAPQTRGVSNAVRETANALREHGAENAQRWDRLNKAFDGAKKAFDKLTTATTRDFIDKLEKGLPQTNPALQPVADAIRAVLDDRLKQVQALGTGKLKQFIENYFPHMWDDPTKASSVLKELASKRPFEGRKSFLKRRSLPLFSDGIARGLTPVTENPVEAMMMRVREMDKYITAQQTFTELRGKSLMWKAPARKVGQFKQLGFDLIADPIATIYANPNRKGGVSIAGYWMAPEPIARVINNYLSPGLRSDPYFGKLFRGYLGAGNLMNAAQLGLSAFHALFVSFDASVGRLALGIEQAAKGNWKDAGKAAGSSLVPFMAAAENFRKGNAMMKEWMKPGSSGDPDIAAAVSAMKAAGGRAGMDSFYHSGLWENMTKTFREGNVLGAAFRSPFAAVEKVASPILEGLVPRMKMGAFFDIMQHEFKPGMTHDELREVSRKAWDSVDNRLGEMVYDNLFWHKAVKDLSMASVRAVGWNLGTIRELGGGTLDAAKAVGRIATGKRPVLSHQLAYTIALPMLSGLVGGVTHYAMTGKRPEELKDYFFPASSQTDKEGNPVRYQMPGYMADVWKYAHDAKTAVAEGRPAAALTTLGNKTHPMVNMILEMLNNKDYYGDKIRNSDDPYIKQLIQTAEHSGKAFVPFGLRDVVKLAGEGQGAKSLLPLAGITRARTDINRSDAENKAAELGHATGGRTPEQVEHGQKVRDLSDSLTHGDPDAQDRIRKAASDGTLTQGDVQRIQRDQRTPGLLERQVSRLDPEQAVKVWDVAAPDERKRIVSAVLSKIRSSKTLDTDRRVALIRQVQSDWQSQSGEGK